MMTAGEKILLIVAILEGVIGVGAVLIRTGGIIQWQKDHDARDTERFGAMDARMTRGGI